MSSTTGVLTSVTAGESTQTTTYEEWGRALSQSDGTGNTATTVYDTAGRVMSTSDGKGTYTYTYDGTDIAGNVEHRGLVTKVDVGLVSDQMCARPPMTPMVPRSRRSIRMGSPRPPVSTLLVSRRR